MLVRWIIVCLLLFIAFVQKLDWKYMLIGMMLSISNVSAKQAANYYQKDNYYTRDKTSQDTWQGSLCQKLGLEEGKPVNAEKFDDLLAQNPKRAAYDLTFSAPKSVSILALTTKNEQIKKDMMESLTQAVQTVSKQIERNEIEARVTKDGNTEAIKTGNMAAAKFTHLVSRNQDPQLHIHCVVLNKTAYNGKIYAISNDNLYQNKILYGQLCRNEMAKNLQARGYAVVMADPERGFWELAEVDQKILETFSTRRKEILEQLKAWNADDAESAQKATLLTRRAKENRDLGELQKSWRQTLNDVGGIKVDKSPSPIQIDPAAKLAAFDRAVARLAEQQFAFSDRDLERAALAEGCTAGMDRNDYIMTHTASIHKKSLIALGHPKNGEDMVYYTTPQNIAVERQIEQYVTKTQNTMSALTKQQVKDDLKNISENKKLTLSKEQTRAVWHVAENKDQFIAIQGLAGTGKTYMLSAANDILVKKWLYCSRHVCYRSGRARIGKRLRH